VIALVVAVVAGTVLLLLPRSAPVVATAPAAPLTLAQAWPDATVVSYADRLDDGSQFTPRLQVDVATAVGTAPTADTTATRILVRTATATTEIHRVSKDRYPEIAGFTVRGDTLVWAETTYPPGVGPLTQLWRTDWRRPGPAALITADAGRAAFFQSQYDIEIVDDRAYWVATQYTTAISTQVRSVPLTGGSVSIREVPGTFALSAWPWLVTPYGGRTDATRMVNLATGQEITVPHTPGELTRCSPIWCRVGITGPNSLVRIDLVHPDGTGRRRMAGGDAVPVLNDVALLDRYEALVMGGQRLDLYDITTGRVVTLAMAVVNAMAHDGLLWWATGPEGAYTWTVLDLRAIRP
jgi:hypothetical protein